MKEKIAFLDRDGALIFEPQDTFQIDRLELLQILPGVIPALKTLIERGYRLVLVSNQDGLGTDTFPRSAFEEPQQKLLSIFRMEGIEFTAVFICPHTAEESCLCRKPKLGLVEIFLTEYEVDLEASFMYGDRETDRQFAKNLGIRFIKAETNRPCLLTQSL